MRTRLIYDERLAACVVRSNRVEGNDRAHPQERDSYRDMRIPNTSKHMQSMAA
jgi:hypothetical protein